MTKRSVVKYNDDKPHRCPVCHAITVYYDGAPPARRLLTLASVTCCRCGTEFTRWPDLPVIIRRGIACEDHRP